MFRKVSSNVSVLTIVINENARVVKLKETRKVVYGTIHLKRLNALFYTYTLLKTESRSSVTEVLLLFL